MLLSTETVCKSGCVVTSMAMALNGRRRTTMNPGDFTTWLKQNKGLLGNLFVWSNVNSFGVSYQGKITGTRAIVVKLCAGSIVILNVRWGGHWVLATGYNGSSFIVNDPGFSQSTYLASEVTQAVIYN